MAAIEGIDHPVCFEARATPVAARRWLDTLRERTDKPGAHRPPLPGVLCPDLPAGLAEARSRAVGGDPVEPVPTSKA
ncbi:MAG: hypothetical protein ACJ72N_16000 [Labedaea sp.]